jgi:hypothetical protein
METIIVKSDDSAFKGSNDIKITLPGIRRMKVSRELLNFKNFIPWGPSFIYIY